MKIGEGSLLAVVVAGLTAGGFTIYGPGEAPVVDDAPLVAMTAERDQLRVQVDAACLTTPEKPGVITLVNRLGAESDNMPEKSKRRARLVAIGLELDRIAVEACK